MKHILRNSPQLVTFILALKLALSQPQQRHITNVADALIVCESRKTLANLYRQFVDTTDSSAVADCFRVSPWNAEDVRGLLRPFVMQDLLARAQTLGAPRILWVSLDDSLSEKDKATRHLELVDWHHDHTESTRKKPVYKNGTVHVGCKIQIGDLSYTFDLRPYLRESTVRRLNRHRSKKRRLHFKTKYTLARQILSELQAWLPADYQVYVLFDSWYASAKLIKFCRRQGWHVVCAIKSNRRLNGKSVRFWDQQLRHQRYTLVDITAADGTSTRYWVRSLQGRIQDVPFPVCVFISRRHPRDKRPKFFLCTDLALDAQTGLTWYSKRWTCEVDNFYLQTALGLGDFRLQSYEAGDKWYAVVFLALVYLEWRLLQERSQRIQSLADVIRQHRAEHARTLLLGACELALACGSVQPVLERFVPEALAQAA